MLSTPLLGAICSLFVQSLVTVPFAYCRCSCFIWLWLKGFCLYMSNMLWRETDIYILYSFSITLGLRFRAIYFARFMHLSHGSLPSTTSITSIKQNGGFWTALDQTPVLWPENTPLTTHLYCFTVNKNVFRKCARESFIFM